MKFEKPYVVCATPRTGSSLLCELLKSTGLAGKPWEYFSVEQQQKLGHKWGVSEFREYFDRAIAEGTTPNGVFGFKIMMRDFSEHFTDSLRGIAATEYKTSPEYDLLHHFFPDLRYIWIMRRNKVRQAVSLLKAIQTKVWVKLDNGKEVPQGELHYRYNTIDILMQRIVIFEATWQEYFAHNNIKPLIVYYEDFVNSHQETVTQILRFLEVEASADLPLRQSLKKQADQLSEIWVERFISEKMAAIMDL